MRTMNCREVQLKIGLLLDGRLNSREEAQLREHMDSCAACRAELAVEEQMLAALASAPSAEPAEGGWERLVRRIEREEAPRRALRPRLAYLMAAMLIVIVVFSAQYVIRPGREPVAERPPQRAIPVPETQESRAVVMAPDVHEAADEGGGDTIQESAGVQNAPPVHKKTPPSKIASGKSRVRLSVKPEPVKDIDKEDPIAQLTDSVIVEDDQSYPESHLAVGEDISTQLDDTLARGLLVLVEAAGSALDRNIEKENRL